MTRRRSEYLLSPLSAPLPPARAPSPWTVRPVEATDRDQLAVVILAAYRGTIDDEGEGHAAALDAVDDWLARRVRAHSVVLDQAGEIAALSFVVIVAGRHYIDPVATAPGHKRHGLGRTAVETSLRSLHAAGIEDVGAVITDGNTASERLFTGLGFVRVGAWA